MCGRYTLMEDAADMEAWFDAAMRGFENFTPNYNVAPSHTMPVVGENKDRDRIDLPPKNWSILK